MSEGPRRRWRQMVVAVLAVCLASYVLLYVCLPSKGKEIQGVYNHLAIPYVHHQPLAHGQIHTQEQHAHRHRKALFQSLSLTEAQCRATFPGLAKPIDDQVAQGPFELQRSGELGPLQARIQDGQLYILRVEKLGVLPGELLDARASALHQINRALLTAPPSEVDSLNTVFSLNIQDQPFGSAWTYSLPAYAAPSSGNAPVGRSFLMPHFSFWAWRPRFIGSFERAAAAVDRLEEAFHQKFAKKDPRAVWRGTARFGSTHHPDLRKKLLEATRGQPWADAQSLDWNEDERGSSGVIIRPAMQDATNALMIEDFCRYKYVVHTEGITYSGRFQFHQLCRSVVLTPPIAWMQHTTHLVKPLYASDLDLQEYAAGANATAAPWAPTADEEAAWPHHRPHEANLVFVAPDWSNLAATVRWLEAHPRVAEGIASRQRELFAEKGYLSPAAEACYWRSLIRGWRSVVQYNESALGTGVPWELYSLSPREGKE